MILQWSINDPAEGARSVEEISHKAKFSSNSKTALTALTNQYFHLSQWSVLLLTTFTYF